MDEDENGDPAHRIFVYVEDDMYDEIRDQTGGTGDDTLSQAQLLASVNSVLDIWNRSTRGVALIYAGTTTADDISQFCSVVPSERPAIYLHFDEDDPGAGARYSYPLSSCTSEQLAEVFFKTGSSDSFYSLGSRASATSPNFETVLIHELGHAIGLGDIDPPAGNCSTHYTAHSVMNGCSTGTYVHPNAANARWFPTSWDKDCADAYSWGRAVNYRWRGWTSAGGTGLTELGSTTYGRGTFAGGYVRLDVGSSRYALYGDDRLRSGSIGSDGNINWPTTDYFDSTELSRGLGDLDVTPLLVSLHEFTPAADPMRIFFLDDEVDTVPSSKYNPPLVESVETDAELDPTAGNDIPLTRCVNAACTSAANVRSHVPLAATWDPVTEQTVVVWVETYSEGGANADADGTMWIHAGFYSHDRLNAGTELGSSTLDRLDADHCSNNTHCDVGETCNVTAGVCVGDGWTWTGQTLHPPAITCSDGTYPFGYYNCIIAWVDRGLGHADGRTLAWTYFKVNTDHTFAFYPISYSQDYFQATGSPALAWFADQFWLAFRGVTSVGTNLRFYSKTAGGDWTNEGSLGGTAYNTVDAPTFIYKDGNESGLVWTESE